ncbi:hypothetical protein ISCGN_003250 [Ixodes scapularis]
MPYEMDSVNTSDKLEIAPDAKGLAARFKRTEGSTLCDLFCPIFTDICQQEKLILHGVDIRIVLRQNTEDCRLLAASTIQQKHIVQLPRIVLYIRRVQVAPTVLVGIERRLQSAPTSYLLRGDQNQDLFLPVCHISFSTTNILIGFHLSSSSRS